MQLIAGPLNGRTLSIPNDKLTPLAGELLDFLEHLPVGIRHEGFSFSRLDDIAETRGSRPRAADRWTAAWSVDNDKRFLSLRAQRGGDLIPPVRIEAPAD